MGQEDEFSPLEGDAASGQDAEVGGPQKPHLPQSDVGEKSTPSRSPTPEKPSK